MVTTVEFRDLDYGNVKVHGGALSMVLGWVGG